MSSFTEAWIPGPKSTSFYTRTYHPTSASPSAVVVFIHGFTEHVARYEHVHMRWADRGFVVFTFDQRGFGRTALDPKKSASAVYGRTGDADQISDIEWALRVAQEVNPTVPLFLMGHSMVRLCPAYLYIFWLCFLKFADGSVYRAVHWYSRSRRVPICRKAFRSCRESLRQVPVFASPNPH
jgi:pimeloyl-ACP methyl ester carboxylesterase